MPNAAHPLPRSRRGDRLGAVRTHLELLFEQTWTLLGEALRTHENPDHPLDAIRLEPRILLSATPIAPVLDAELAGPVTDGPATTAVVSPTPSAPQSTEQDATRVEWVIIDSRLSDAQRLFDDLTQRDPEGVKFELLIVDADRDGLDQISDSLRGYQQVDAVHIVSHGTDGKWLLGSSLVTNDNLDRYADQLSSWQTWLSADADILIYGCDVAAGASGQTLVTRIASLTGADVGASVDATGAHALGGNWDLEFMVGQLSTGSVVSGSFAESWTGLLQAITVTTLSDVVDGDTSSISALLASQGTDGFISLREAIIASNQTAGSDVIFLGDGVYTLSIAGSGETFAFTGDLDIRGDLDIVGMGSGRTSIDAAGIDRVFSIRNDAQVKMNDLTILGGNAGAGEGGGVLIVGRSSLTLQQVEVSSNTAFKGAGIFLDNGVLKVVNSTIAANLSGGFGGGIYNDRGDVLLESSALLHNTATTAGGGIYNAGIGATLALTNATVSGNSSAGEGGAIYNQRSASIVHSTIAYNSAANAGGIYLASTGTLSIQNSILAVNSGGNANTTLTGSLGNNLSDNVTSGLTHASDIIDASPGLGTLGNHGGFTQTIAIVKTSAAINAGAATGKTQIDQRGYLRDINPDIGAFEYQRLAATGEILVNTTSAGAQQTSASTAGNGLTIRGSQQSVAIDINGNYVVVWQSQNQDGSGWGVFAKRFSANGMAITDDIQVNQFTAGDQHWARVASDAQGNFVVTWTSESQDGTASSVYARRFGADGAALANEFRVNATATNSQGNSVIAMDALTGDFVIAWEGAGPGDTAGIFFRRFAADGTSADVSDRLANSVNRGTEGDPAITMLSGGSFAITWTEASYLYLQRFSADGSSLGGEVAVAGLLVSIQTPSIDADADGNFVVVYRDMALLTPGIRGMIFNADGTIRVADFLVDDAVDAKNPAVSMADDGTFVVVWNEADDSSGQAVNVRRYAANGNALTAATRVNVTQSGDQHLPSVAAVDANNYVVVWSGQSAGDGSGVVARQYGIVPLTNIAPVAVDDAYVVNPNGMLRVDAHLDWHDHDWQYRQLLTVSVANPSLALIDYPVLVRLHTSAVDAVNIDYLQFGATGQDLRFIDGDGNFLDYQIATWNSAGYSEVWVKVPLLETDHAHNSFFMYYGNAGATDAQQAAALWDAQFAGVYHLNGSSVGATSTGPSGVDNVTYAPGLITEAASFNGSSNRINLGSDAVLDNLFAGGGTISAWINPADWGGGDAGRIVDKSQSSGGVGGFVIKVSGSTSMDGAIVFEHDFSGTIGRWRTAPGSIALDTWQQVVVSYDNSNAANAPVIYINGVQQSLVIVSAPVGTAISDAAQDFTIGNYRIPNRAFDGQIDELRVSRSLLDAQWIVQDHHSILAASTTSAVQQSRPQGLLRNDSDADNDSLSVSLVTGPARAAAFTLYADGSFTYQHNGHPATLDSFVYQVSDGQGGVSTATAYITITNTPPSVSAISNRTVLEDTASGAIAFVVGDAESNLSDLVVSVTSNNQSLITDGSLSLSGSGENRALSFTPQSNASGTATITVSVGDGIDTTSQSFTVIVQAVNDAPTMSAISDQSVDEDTSSSVIAFTVADVDHAAASLIVTASSSNSSLIADGAITLGGTAANRTIAFTPQGNAFGTTVITVTVADGVDASSQSFTVTVQGVNDAPTMSAISDQSVDEDTSSSVIAFTVADVDHAATSLIVTASSSNSSLIADGSITLGGTAGNRSIAFTPQGNAFGTTVITVTVADGVDASSQSFTVTVQAVNDAPLAVADSVTLNAFVTTTIFKSHLLANDFDIEGDLLSVQIVSGPGFGTLEVLASGDLRYRQTAHAGNGDAFSYRLWDGAAWSDPAIVTLNINSVTPVVLPDSTPTESASRESSSSDSEADGSKESDSTVSDEAIAAAVVVNVSISVTAGTGGNVNEPPLASELAPNDADSLLNEAARTEGAALEGDDALAGSPSGLATRASSLGSMNGDSRGRGLFSVSSTGYDTTQMTLTQPQFWLALDSMKQDVSSSLTMTGGITVGAAATTTVGMTVGYVVWVLRSGLLLSSVMAHLPMWRFMDPLSILDSSDSDVEEDQETLVSIADGDTAADPDVPSDDAAGGNPT